MNEFDYINYRLYDLIKQKDVKAAVIYFENNYRYNGLKVTINKNKMNELDTNLDFRETLFQINRARTIGNYQFLNHSYEPLHYILDEQLFKEFCFHWAQFRDFFIFHSEKNSKDLDTLASQGLTFIHWFANGYICSNNWFRNYKDINIVTEYVPIQHRFICANRLIDDARIYRIKFLNLINTHNGLYSLLDHDPYTNRSLEEIYPENLVKPHSFDKHENSSAWLNLEEFHYTDVNGKHVFMPSAWKSSFLHVVPETVVDRVHLTEKIFKPIILKQPFVLINGCGGLEYLRSYGFKTFNEFWSEDYDNIEDLDARLQAVANIVNYIGDCSFSELELMREKMKPILEYNYNWFYNGFADQCWQELSDNVKGLSLTC